MQPALRLVSILSLALWIGISPAPPAGAQEGAQEPEGSESTPVVPTEPASKFAGFALPQLPSGPVEVTVLELAAPRRFVELTRRFQTSLDQNADWLPGYIQENGGPGQPLPWHPNFGLTEEEYAEYQKLSDEIRLQPAGKATIEVVREDPWISFKAAAPLAALNGVTLDLGQRKVTTPFGDCANFFNVGSDMDTRAAEPWKGMTCQRTQGDPKANGQIVAFSLGRYVEDEALFLSYEGKKIQNGQFVERADVFLSIP